MSIYVSDLERELKPYILELIQAGGAAGPYAPASGSYLVLGLSAGLSAERVLTDGHLMTHTDGGANSTYTFGIDTTKLQWSSGKLDIGVITTTLATNTVNVDNIQFDLTPTPAAPAEGLLYWNTDDGTLNLGMPGGSVNLQLGQEMLMLVKNESGSAVANGQLVYISGGTGNRALISLAKADADATSHTTIGMATEAIANNQQGYITTTGYVRDVDTIAYAPGTMLYLSATTAGAYTSTRPVAPLHGVEIGVVIRQHATEGIIYVTIDRGLDLSDLHDVLISGLANLDVLQYDSAALVWKNRTTAAAGIVTGSGAAGGVAFWSGTNTLSADATNLYWDDAQNYLGVGDASPNSRISVISADANVANFSSSFAGVSTTTFRNTAAAATTNTAGFAFTLATDTNAGRGAGSIRASFTDITDATRTSAFAFFTANNGTAAERMRLVGQYLGLGVTAPAVLFDARENTAVTNAVQNLLDLSHTTSGTAADGFGLGTRHYLEDAGGTRRQALNFSTIWSTAAAATRKAYSVINPFDTAERNGLRLYADGSRALSGFNLAANSHSVLQVGGSFALAYNATAVDLTLDATHAIVRVTAASKTITLPTAANIAGRMYKISFDYDGSVATTGGETLDGLASPVAFIAGETVDVYSDGTNWQI